VDTTFPLMVVSMQFFMQHATMLPKTISTSLSTIRRESRLYANAW
jgi:hypothetical protein